jgi:hypothetical protein
MSVTGLFTRWLWAPQADQPSAVAHALAQGAILASSMILIALTLYAVRRLAPTERSVPIAFSLLIVAMLLLSPINGNYNLVLLALPLTVIGAYHARLPHGSRLTFYLAVGLISLPVEYCTLGLPSVCALLNGPVLGQLLLWLVLLRLSWDLAPTTPASQPAARSR